MNRLTIFSLVLTIAACSDDPNGASTNDGAVISGRQAAAPSATKDLAETAIAGTIRADGSFESISGASSRVDADGSFRLTLPAADQAWNNLMVRFDTFGQTDASVLVAGPVGDTDERVTAPADLETTLESEVWTDLLSRGLVEADAGSQAWLRSWVNEDTAMTNPTSRDVSDATASSMLAFQGIVDASADGANRDALDVALTSLASARVRLDESLDESTSAEKTADIHATAEEQVVTAFADAGMSANLVADATWAGAAAVDGSSDTRAATELWLTGEMRLAERSGQAMAGSATELGLDSEVDAAVETLVTAMVAASSSSTPGEDVDDAWADFRSDVELSLSDALPLLTASVLLDVQASLDAASDMLSDARAEANAATTVTATADATVDGVLSFREEASVDSSLELLTQAGLSDTEADATVDILAQLALAAS